MSPASEERSLCFERTASTSCAENPRQVTEDTKWLLTIIFLIKQFINFSKCQAYSEATTLKGYEIIWLKSPYLWVKAFDIAAM